MHEWLCTHHLPITLDLDLYISILSWVIVSSAKVEQLFVVLASRECMSLHMHTLILWNIIHIPQWQPTCFLLQPPLHSNGSLVPRPLLQYSYRAASAILSQWAGHETTLMGGPPCASTHVSTLLNGLLRLLLRETLSTTRSALVACPFKLSTLLCKRFVHEHKHTC